MFDISEAGKYFESSTKKEGAEDEKDEQTKGSGEGTKTNDIDGTTPSRILEAATFLSSEANKSSDEGSDGILAITTASSLLTVRNFGEAHKIGEEETEKADIIIFQSSKASINHTPTESRISLERSSKSPIILTPKTLALQNFEAVSSEVKSSKDNSGKSTVSEIPEVSIYSKGAESVHEARSMKGAKLENAAVLENGEVKTTITVTKSDLTKWNELIGTKSSIETIQTRATDKEIFLTTPSTVEEKNKTTTYITRKSSEIQVSLTDKEIDDPLTSPYQTTISETKSSPFVPESNSQWKKEEQKLRLGNTTSEAEVAIIVKEETVIPTVIEVTPIVAAKSNLPDSTTGSGRSGKLHDATLKVGLEIAKIAPTTEPEIGIEILGASGKYSVEADTSSVPYAKSTKPVQLLESTVKFESDLTTVSQKTETTKSEFIQTSVPIEMTQNETQTIISKKHSEQPTKKIESTEVSSFGLTSANTKGDDTVIRNIVTAATSASGPSSFDQQLSVTTPNTALVPVTHGESSRTISTQYLITTTKAQPTKSATGAIPPVTSSASQATTANMSLKLISGSDTEVVAMTESVARDDENFTLRTKHHKMSPIKNIEVEGSKEEVTDFQTVRSTEGFVSNTVIETNDLLKKSSTVATSDKVDEVGLEIVLVKGYPKRTEASFAETNASLQRNWTDVVTTSQDVILNASLSPMPTMKSDKENVSESVSDSAKEKSATGEFSTLDSQELGSTVNIYRSETAFTSTSGATEIAVTSKQSASESTSPTTHGTLSPADIGARLENTSKPTDNDKTDRLGTIATPQSKDSSTALLSSSTKENLVKASEISEGSANLTAENIAKIKTVAEEVKKGVATTDERTVHFSSSTAVDLNNTFGSLPMVEVTTWKPNVNNVTDKNIFGSELVISTIPKNASVETQPGVTRSESKVTEALGEPKETASKITEFTVAVNRATTASATASVTTVEGTRITAIPQIKIETFSTSESASTKETEYEISRTTATSDIFSQSKNTEALTIPLSVEQRTSGLKSDVTSVSKLETTTESVTSGNLTQTLKSVKDKGFSKFMVTGKASTLETASVPTARESVLTREGASPVFRTTSPASRTSTNPSLPFVEIVAKNGSTGTVPNSERYPSLLSIPETEDSLVTPSIITSHPQISQRFFETAASRTTLAENTIGLHNFGTSKTDFSSMLTLSKSNLEIVATTDNTDLLKVEPTATGWTTKLETKKSEDTSGDESLLKITQQVRFRPFSDLISPVIFCQI